MTIPLVSVKMITYNHAPFIAQAIEGVLQQKTDFPFELVIGEDCSTDGTRKIVFEYQKKYPHIIRVITSDKNVGMKKNGLRTMKAGTGKYIAFCEGDDYWQSHHKLQKQADYLEGHADCGLVFSSYDVYHVTTKKKIEDFIRYRKKIIPENLSLFDIVAGNGAPLTCTVMARRTLCEEIMKSDPYLHKSGHFLMGDTQLWAEMATKARLYYIPESMATHIITEESATRSKDVKKELRFTVSNVELMLYLCRKYDPSQQLKNKYEAYLYECTSKLASHTRNKELADEVRREKKSLTGKDRLRYYGAKNPIVYYPLRLAVSFRNVFKRKNSRWS